MNVYYVCLKFHFDELNQHKLDCTYYRVVVDELLVVEVIQFEILHNNLSVVDRVVEKDFQDHCLVLIDHCNKHNDLDDDGDVFVLNLIFVVHCQQQLVLLRIVQLRLVYPLQEH